MKVISLWLYVLTALLLAPRAVSDAADAPTPPRPRLQIINGSSQTIDILWLKSDTGRGTRQPTVTAGVRQGISWAGP